MDGKLSIVGVPLGNREDITLRALKTLFSSDLILCEDTRMTHRLLNLYEGSLLEHLGIEVLPEKENKPARVKDLPRLERFDEMVENQKTAKVVEWLKEGMNISLVSDAGMPLVSDPGFPLIKACYEAGIGVEVVPGPTALTSALALAGLPSETVLFLGFLPKKAGKRQKIWEWVKQAAGEKQVTVVIYESPFRVRQLITEAGEVFGPEVQVAAVSELTKMHEKVVQGAAGEVLASLPEVVKGEWVVLIEAGR